MKANGKAVLKKEKECYIQRVRAHMKDNLEIIKSMALECKNTFQETSIKVSFKITPSMVKVPTAGKMELGMKETL
jgi:hypothetical protein